MQLPNENFEALVLGKDVEVEYQGTSQDIKNLIVTSLVGKNYQSDHVKTVVDRESITINHNAKSYTLSISNTTGGATYSLLKTQAYVNKDVYILPFIFRNPSAIELMHVFYKEVKNAQPNAKILVVGVGYDSSGERHQYNESEEAALDRFMRVQFGNNYVSIPSINSQTVKTIFACVARALLNLEGEYGLDLKGPDHFDGILNGYRRNPNLFFSRLPDDIQRRVVSKVAVPNNWEEPEPRTFVLHKIETELVRKSYLGELANSVSSAVGKLFGRN